MSNRYEIIDVNSWKRSVHCQVFRNMVQPQYCVTVNLDVTNFYCAVKEKRISFTLSLIYVVTKCANEIEEFRYRFLDGEVVLYESIDTSFAHIVEGDDLFKVINAPMYNEIEEYVNKTEEIISCQKEYFTGPMKNDVYTFSALPWIKYSHISHTISGQKEKAQPIFNWGKFDKVEGRLSMPFSIQVHHSFVDGIHIGRLVEKIQNYLDEM